jgi:hypothetical protein
MSAPRLRGVRSVSAQEGCLSGWRAPGAGWRVAGAWHRMAGVGYGMGMAGR